VKIEGTKFSLLEKTIRVKFSNKNKYKNMPIYEDWKNSSFAYYIKLGKTEYYFTNKILWVKLNYKQSQLITVRCSSRLWHKK
jgi:hypothetical protein